MIVALPTLALPRRFMLGVLRRYSRSTLWLLRVVCEVDVEWRGREKLPQGAYLVACKHQSLWETFALFMLLPDPTYILKRELMWIPLFGWLASKARMIPINRGARAAAMARMAARAREEIRLARQIVIFPEGTRRPPAPSRVICLVSRFSMTNGLALRADCAQFRTVLAAPHIAPLSRHGLGGGPGPIEPGLDKRAFLARLQAVLEEATARLVAEGQQSRI